MNLKLNHPAQQAAGCSRGFSKVPSGPERGSRPGISVVSYPLACWSETKRWVKQAFKNRARFSRHQNISCLVFLGLLVLIVSIIGSAQEKKGVSATKHNTRPEQPAPASRQTADNDGRVESVQYSYEFSQPQFYIRHITIEHDSNGQGKISFERLHEETAIVETVEISPAALGRISALWQALKFLDSDTSYQADRQFPHLGTMRITMVQGTRKRTAEFNWTNNHEAAALINEYRRVADQAIFVFDVSVARENQPLNAPKLMEQLESMLKRNWLSDPQQLIPLLKEISTDEHLPLIARNHATRLLKKIQK